MEMLRAAVSMLMVPTEAQGFVDYIELYAGTNKLIDR